MCFSAESSMISFLIGVFGSILCISLNSPIDKIIGYFMGFVACMQGLDYLLWTHLICDGYNRFISIIAMIFNHLQPIILGIILLVINTKISSINKKAIVLVMVMYLCVIIPYSLQFIRNKKDQCTLKTKQKGNIHDVFLLWNWNNMLHYTTVYNIFIITLSLLFILGTPTIKYGIYGCIILSFTYIMSIIFYQTELVGQMWCYYVVGLPLLWYTGRRILYSKN